MSNDYGDLLGLPGARGSVVTGFVARLPMSMLGVAFVLLVTSTLKSYAIAGMLSGSLLLTQALTAAYRGRLADRWGQRRAALPMVIAHFCGLLAIMVVCLLHGPLPLLLAVGLLAGTVFPPIGALVRSRWTERLSDPGLRGGAPSLATALSLESAVDEVVYIVGPVLTTAAAGIFGPAAGLGTAMTCTLVGGILFLTRPGANRPRKQPVERSGSLLRIDGMPVAAAVCVALGTVLGSVEVTIVAFAREHGSTLLSGPIVAAFSVGSLASGIAYGARKWSRPPGFRLVVSAGCLLVGVIPVLLAPNLGLLALSVTVAGLAVSPMLIGAHELVQIKVPAHKINEGFSWIQTTIGLGLGVGVTAAGVVTEQTNAHTAFLVAGIAAVAAALLAVVFRRGLGRVPAPAAAPAEPEPVTVANSPANGTAGPGEALPVGQPDHETGWSRSGSLLRGSLPAYEHARWSWFTKPSGPFPVQEDWNWFGTPRRPRSARQPTDHQEQWSWWGTPGESRPARHREGVGSGQADRR